MSSNANEVHLDRVVEDLKRIVRDSEVLLADSTELASEKGRQAKERWRQAVAAAKVTCRPLEDRAIEGAKATDRVIRAHPYQAIGIAAAIGVVVGVLVARK